MELREYARMDATGLKDLLERREVTRGELFDLARAAIAQVDPVLGAVVGDVFDEPPAYAASGPFSGVPFALKDLLCTAAGVRSENGSALTAGHVAPHDSDLMARWRAAGLAVVCRTSTPEFGFSATTEPVANGPTRNPWDPSRVAGGSSGGSAALVAAGALPWAHANDAGGSIRVPAALCGVFGLKPTRGLVPPGPDSDEPLFGLTAEFAVTRSVRDAAALLDLVHGSAPGDRYHVRGRAPGEFVAALGLRPRGLRVAVSTDSPGGRADPAVASEVVRIAELLEEFGDHVEWASPEIDDEHVRDLNMTFWSVSIADTVRALTGGRDVEHALALVETTTAAMVRHGLSLRWEDVSRARAYQNRLTRSMADFLDRFDLVLTPVTPSTAWPVGELDSNRPGIDARGWVDTLSRYSPFTALYNATGQPAVSVPTGMTGGLPVGVQLAAAPGQEDLLLAVAAQLEEADPWRERVPPVHAGGPPPPWTGRRSAET
ncbi:amidase [Streptomyces sp. NBC_01363]|uniref:amidase n=1 Tax=Streptomyces sp. NBC_01363 TaxID=2903840 RepID=UPI00224F5D34|nr:amidase [Streptomyces sp. NBC_01363]MCX4736954.1 amidase [Streptomyces sp. NBC_01363]